MSGRRKIYRSGFLHICQKSADNGIIFYVLEDFLVFYSVLSVKAVIFGIVILAIDIMFNHFHLGILCRDERKLAGFMNSSTSVFARMYNRHYGLEGQLFKRPFKSVPKMTETRIRDCLFYIWNNPKEKKAVKLAEEYRWNFLKYLESDNPYSEPVNLTTASENLVGLIRDVETRRRAGKYLDYGFFDERYKSLSKDERLQLIDHIIVSYNMIRRDTLIEMFESYQTLLTAVNAVTGNEYGMSDDNDDEDYRHYRQMIVVLKREGIDLDKVRFRNGYFEGNESLLTRLRKLLKAEVGASDYEVAKFLHLL